MHKHNILMMLVLVLVLLQLWPSTSTTVADAHVVYPLSNGTRVNGLSASTGYFLHEQFYPPVLLGDAHHTSF